MRDRGLKNRLQRSRFFSGENQDGEPVGLNHRRIFILPTLRGLGFALLLTVLLLIAYVYNNNLVYLLTFLLTGIAVVSILHTYRMLSGLVLEPSSCKPVFLGEPAHFGLKVINPTATPRPHIQVKLAKTDYLSLPAQSDALVALSAAPIRRGWYKAGTVSLANTFPLGLFRAWSPIRFNWRMLVYPSPSAKTLPFPQAADGADRQNGRRRGSDEFNGLRGYRPGDNLRQIHWQTYAKGLGLYSKEFAGGDSAADIHLDYGQAPGFNVEERLSQLCRWIIDAEAQGLRYGLLLPGFRRTPSRGPAHYRACLEALALF